MYQVVGKVMMVQGALNLMSALAGDDSKPSASDAEKFEHDKTLAQNGNVEAQVAMYFHYVNGSGCPKNVDEAIKWCKLAIAMTKFSF